VSRSVLAESALELGSDVLLFIDADIVFPVPAAEELVERAFELQAVVGAIYSSKRPGGKAIVEQEPNAHPMTCFKGGMVRPVRSVGMGLTAIHRSVLEKTPARNLLVKSLGEPRRVRMWFATTDPAWDEVESDDYAFCRRVREAHGQIYADGSQRIEHVGLYRFRLEDLARPLVEAETLILPAPPIVIPKPKN
jgi:hypothetical protein